MNERVEDRKGNVRGVDGGDEGGKKRGRPTCSEEDRGDGGERAAGDSTCVEEELRNEVHGEVDGQRIAEGP